MTDQQIETAARALNFEAGRQRGLTFEDDWDTLTEQERGGWRRCARAALAAFADEIPHEQYWREAQEAMARERNEARTSLAVVEGVAYDARAEVERLRALIVAHMDEIDEAICRGLIFKRDRDDIDNALYNAAGVATAPRVNRTSASTAKEPRDA